MNASIVLFTDKIELNQVSLFSYVLNMENSNVRSVTYVLIGSRDITQYIQDNLDSDRIIHYQLSHSPTFDDGQSICDALLTHFVNNQNDIIIFDDTVFSNEIAAILAHRLGEFYMNRVVDWKVEQNRHNPVFVVRRTEYSGNLVTTYRVETKRMVFSVMPIAFAGKIHFVRSSDAQKTIKKRTSIERLHLALNGTIRSINSLDKGAGALASAKIVLAIGQGVSNRKDVDKLISWSVRKNIEYGVTRPLILNGWVSSTRLIGSSGVSIAPDLLITVGLSGSGPFLAGAQYAGKTVSVNKDPNANIFKYSDIGYVCPWEKVFSLI